MSYRIAKIVMLGGAFVYGIVANLIFSELHETDFHVAITASMVCLFASMSFLIGYVSLITYHHIKILYEKIEDMDKKRDASEYINKP